LFLLSVINKHTASAVAQQRTSAPLDNPQFESLAREIAKFWKWYAPFELIFSQSGRGFEKQPSSTAAYSIYVNKARSGKIRFHYIGQTPSDCRAIFARSRIIHEEREARANENSAHAVQFIADVAVQGITSLLSALSLGFTTANSTPVYTELSPRSDKKDE
jgi:hypothetical protein